MEARETKRKERETLKRLRVFNNDNQPRRTHPSRQGRGLIVETNGAASTTSVPCPDPSGRARGRADPTSPPSSQGATGAGPAQGRGARCTVATVGPDHKQGISARA